MVDRNEYRPLEGMRKVSLKGTQQQIEFAKGLIEEKVEQFKGSKIPAKRRGNFCNTFVHHFLRHLKAFLDLTS